VIVVPSSAPFVKEEYTAEDFTDHLKVSVQDMGSTAKDSLSQEVVYAKRYLITEEMTHRKC
jgi:hypothetical protein